MAASLQTGPRPAYEAISYVWGDSTEMNTVLVNGKSTEVTQNCFQVQMILQHRLPEGTLFWIDALCINQEDDAEKGHQIHAMGPI